MDELPELPRDVLELLRQPLEDEKVTIARANATITYPSKFMLVAAMNPCPCGFYGDPFHELLHTVSNQQISFKISGPLMDRIDMQLQVAPVKYADLEGPSTTDSESIRKTS